MTQFHCRPSTRLNSLLLSVCVVAMAAMSTLAAPPIVIVPRVPAAPTIYCVVEKTASGWRARMSDGSMLFSGWMPTTTAPAGFLAPTSIKVVPRTNGVSIEWIYKNNTTLAAVPNDLELPLLAVGSTPQIIDTSFMGTATPIAAAGSPWVGGVYPRDLYSPITALKWGRSAVGISLLYPVLQYQHDAAVVVRDMGGGRWKPMVALSNAKVGGHWTTYLGYQASIAPGGEKRYTIELRANAGGRDWTETFEPYRQYFHSQYGSVRYARDGRTIRAIQLAMGDRQTVANPDGWIAESGRPDLNGYLTVANLIRSNLLKADRTILWTPTGLYKQNVARNYPFRFTSRWTDANATVGMRRAPEVLSTISMRPGQSWGLWWGRAAHTQSRWDSADFKPITHTDPNAMKLAQQELDIAVGSGAKIIGLDAFTHNHSPIWELRPWLEQMVGNNSGVVFCTEGRNPDVMHLIAPTWVDTFGTDKAHLTNGNLLSSRFVLADWLIPGHETWASLMWNRADRLDLRQPASGSNARAQEVLRLQALGYVPVLFGD